MQPGRQAQQGGYTEGITLCSSLAQPIAARQASGPTTWKIAAQGSTLNQVGKILKGGLTSGIALQSP